MLVLVGDRVGMVEGVSSGGDGLPAFGAAGAELPRQIGQCRCALVGLASCRPAGRCSRRVDFGAQPGVDGVGGQLLAGGDQPVHQSEQARRAGREQCLAHLPAGGGDGRSVPRMGCSARSGPGGQRDRLRIIEAPDLIEFGQLCSAHRGVERCGCSAGRRPVGRGASEYPVAPAQHRGWVQWGWCGCRCRCWLIRGDRCGYQVGHRFGLRANRGAWSGRWRCRRPWGGRWCGCEFNQRNPSCRLAVRPGRELGARCRCRGCRCGVRCRCRRQCRLRRQLRCRLRRWRRGRIHQRRRCRIDCRHR